MFKIKHGMLPVNIDGITQYWFISESKKRTYILITEEGKLTKNKKFRECKIIDWSMFDYIGWWLDE